ncbi:hypothetical protein CC80DRAFT_495889 [Byssothecium circinans]|uniref:Uncharacterized protein n=1 Tax=Byssothecium circinans TaxID=147558 RepID=A0A6A5TLN4_9PLEO|nr:hypothetical protein CC80DRAFT_495889 [Byssothecium circinans]
MARALTQSRPGVRPSTPPPQIPSELGSPSSKARSPKTSTLAYLQSPRRIEEKQRQAYVDHLSRWAADHDSSHYFHGNIGLAPSATVQTFELGASIQCILTDRDGVRKTIIVRLYGPQRQEQRYKLVIRCGAGWMSAREYLSKEFFTHQQSLLTAKKHPHGLRRYDGITRCRSDLVPKADDKDTVAIQPLFRRFLELPLELQQNVVGVAAGLTGRYKPGGRNNPSFFPPRTYADRYARKQSNISLATVFKISKFLNESLVPWIFPTTDFYFEITGFTNFLWAIGPTKRALIRHITFDFESLAALHCIRWLAPDPVFELFEPPINTDPPALRYLWRLQIQDLARELHLSTLTLDISSIEAVNVPIVVRILKGAFGSIRFLRFLYNGHIVRPGHHRLRKLGTETSWRQMCRDWYERHRQPPTRWYMSYERKMEGVEELEKAMDKNSAFFDGAW